MDVAQWACVLKPFAPGTINLQGIYRSRQADNGPRGHCGTAEARGMDLLRGLVELTRYNTTIPGLVSLYCVLSAEETDPEHPAHVYFLRRYNWVRDIIGEAFTAVGELGQLRPGVAPVAATRQLVALMDGLQVQWLLDNDSVDMPAEVVAVLEAITTEKF